MLSNAQSKHLSLPCCLHQPPLERSPAQERVFSDTDPIITVAFSQPEHGEKVSGLQRDIHWQHFFPRAFSSLCSIMGGNVPSEVLPRSWLFPKWISPLICVMLTDAFYISLFIGAAMSFNLTASADDSVAFNTAFWSALNMNKVLPLILATLCHKASPVPSNAFI